MNMQTSIRSVLRKYAKFSGRAQRSEYWWWILFFVLANYILQYIDGIIFGYGPDYFSLLSGVFSLIMLIPNIAVTARRLHDTDRSGWWQLIIYAPMTILVVIMLLFGTSAMMVTVIATLLCVALVLYWLTMKGTDGPNRFGEDPLLK